MCDHYEWSKRKKNTFNGILYSLKHSLTLQSQLHFTITFEWKNNRQSSNVMRKKDGILNFTTPVYGFVS